MHFVRRLLDGQLEDVLPSHLDLLSLHKMNRDNNPDAEVANLELAYGTEDRAH
jgi:hypothetical protein